MFRPSIHLPAKIAGFRQYSQYAAFIVGIFFFGMKQGGIYTGLLVDTVYIGHTSQYSTELTSLIFNDNYLSSPLTLYF